MPVLHDPNTNYAKELWKWENPRSLRHPDTGERGMRPDSFEPYPAMLYLITGKNPWRYESHTVHDEQEQRNLESRGYVAGGLQAACKEYDRRQQANAVAAAERNAQDRTMSESAKSERDLVEQSHSRHLPEITPAL